MKLTISKNANVNYLAKIVKLNNFSKHPNPEVTKMKCAHVDGFTICMGANDKEGLYVYFPTSCTINPKLLSYCNLYRHSELNSNPEKSGFFEDNGRVKSIKLKGQISEGFLLPLLELQNFILDSVNVELKDITENTEFDTVEHNGKEFWISKKYIVKSNIHIKNNNIVKKCFNKAIENQFRFHYETVNVKKDPYCIQPNDLIHLSYKLHGTSGCFANVLCYKELSFKDKIKNILSLKKINTPKIEYDNIYSSRKVIKSNYNLKSDKSDSLGYYNCDVWEYANKFLKPYLIKGMTIYAEIIGYLPIGKYIQENYDYGCIRPNGFNDYFPEKNFKVRIYRITLTNVDGIVHEFSPMEVKTWCENNNLIPVTTCYYGLAKDLYPDIKIDDDWFLNFWEKLSNDKNFYMELNSPHCINKVPHEGLVIKKDDMRSRAWKLKCFAFLQGEAKQLDNNKSNIEDEN